MGMAATKAGVLRRDVEVMGLVGTAHFTSHFFQLALAPLFPILAVEFNVGYAELGAITGLFYAVSGIFQAAAGFLVDRIGARRVLIGGVAVMAGATCLMGFTHTYWALLPLAALAGMGNAVFHPADFAILNASVAQQRLGRAFSIHGFSGNLGYASAPALVWVLAEMFGWRHALIGLGLIGLLVAAVVASRAGIFADHRAGTGGRGQEPSIPFSASLKLLIAVPILTCFGYFTLTAASMIGLQQFSVPTLMQLYGVPQASAAIALTSFMLGSAAGVLAGGVLADRTTRHALVAATGMSLAAAWAGLLATGAVPALLLPVIMALAGICMGFTGPSRDLLVRSATPKGALGRVYGFVYSGLDLGGATAPILMGVLLDHGEPRYVLMTSALLMLFTVATVVKVGKVARPATAAA